VSRTNAVFQWRALDTAAIPRYIKMIVSVTEAANLTIHLIVVCDLTEMCASLNLRSVIALTMQLNNTFRYSFTVTHWAEMSGNIFFNPIPSHSQWFIPIPIPNPMFSLVLFPFPSHSHWLFPFTTAHIPVLLIVSRSDNKWPVNSTMHTTDKSST